MPAIDSYTRQGFLPSNYHPTTTTTSSSSSGWGWCVSSIGRLAFPSSFQSIPQLHLGTIIEINLSLFIRKTNEQISVGIAISRTRPTLMIRIE